LWRDIELDGGFKQIHMEDGINSWSFGEIKLIRDRKVLLFDGE